MGGPSEPNRNPFEPDVGRARNRIHERVYDNLQRIPGIVDVRFERSGTGIGQQIRGDVDTTVFAQGLITAEAASIQANWWPQPDDETDWFQVHYFEVDGFDCGWHRHENDHVDGLDHYQERESPDEAYRYEVVNLGFLGMGTSFGR